MTDFVEKLDQLQVKFSLELNAIETTQFFLQKEGVNMMKLGIKRHSLTSENTKKGVNPREVPTTFKYGSDPLVLYPTERYNIIL